MLSAKGEIFSKYRNTTKTHGGLCTTLYQGGRGGGRGMSLLVRPRVKGRGSTVQRPTQSVCLREASERGSWPYNTEHLVLMLN